MIILFFVSCTLLIDINIIVFNYCVNLIKVYSNKLFHVGMFILDFAIIIHVVSAVIVPVIGKLLFCELFLQLVFLRFSDTLACSQVFFLWNLWS